MATRRTKKRPFVTHFRRALDHRRELAPLAVIPILLALLDGDSIQAVLDHGGDTHVNIAFPYPGPFTDTWSFASTPVTEATVGGPAADLINVPMIDLPVELLSGWLFVWAVLSAAVFTIYIAGIDRRFNGDAIQPLQSLKQYGGQFLLYGFAAIGIGVAILLLSVTGPAGALLATVGMLALGYAFYPVPFLLVAADTTFVEAVKRSYRSATGLGKHLQFFVGHLLVGLVISVPATLVVVNTGIAGLVIGLAVLGPVALLFTAASYSFVHRQVRAGGI